MKSKLMLGILVSFFCVVSSYSQTTAFTYQGKLSDGAGAASGNYDFEFRLFDDPTAGSQQGPTLSRPAVAVVNGIFTVILDFGNQFNGARYLEISVKSSSSGSFNVLMPRQQMASGPYAIRSLSSASADGLSALCINCVTDAQINTVSANKVTGMLPLANGGTGANTAPTARTNLGLGPLAVLSPTGTAGATTFLRGDNTWSAGPIGPQGNIGPPGPQGPAGPVGSIASVHTQFSADDRIGWVHLEILGDDACQLNIPLGFTFTGWNRPISTVSMSGNGILFFGQACNSAFTNTGLPSGISTDPFVAAMWEDFDDFGTGEFMEYQTFGTAPGRVFQLFFRTRLHATAPCGTNQMTMMISIHEGSNVVNVGYSGFTACLEMRGGGATFGMQGPGGAAATDVALVGVNSPILDDNSLSNSISYQPSKQ